MLKIIVSKDRELVIVIADAYSEVRTVLMARADVVIVKGQLIKNRYA